jgi:Type IV secretion-system coupling protein DNA-binding domain
MSIEKAMIAQAPPYMVAAMAREFIGEEVLKGCRPDITSQPVSLEPNFYPIWALRDKKGSQRQPDYTIEIPISSADLVRQQIWISPDQKFDWNNSELFSKQLQTISFRLGFEVIGNSENIIINLLCNRFDLPIIKAAFQGVFDFCELSKVTDHPFTKTPFDLWEDTCFRDYFPCPPYYNLLTRPPEIKTSPLKPLIIALSSIKSPVIGFYQALFEPVPPAHNWHRNVEILLDIEYIHKLQSGFQVPQRYSQQAPSGDLRHMAMDLESKAHNDKPFFTMALRVGVVGGGDEREDLLSSIATFISLFQYGGRPLAFINQGTYSLLQTDQIRNMFIHGLVYRPGFLVNSWELTGPVHVPSLEVNEYRSIPISVLETLPVRNPDLLTGTCIGTCEYAGKIQNVCIPKSSRRRGTHPLGRAGTGKSTLLEHIILSDIEEGHGVAVIDPHNDLIERILRLIPEKYVERTIYFNPGDPDWVPLWNPIEKIIGQDIGRTTNDIVNAIESFVAGGGWGDRLENILRNVIYALIVSSDGTFLEVSNLLRNKSEHSKMMRKKILETIDNETVRQFWLYDYESYGKTELGPPINKLSKLLVSDSVSLMLSQPENRFNIRKIMDEGMIFLINLSDVGLIVRRVLGAFMLSFFHLNALARSNLPIQDRRQFHIHCDEVHQFVTDSIEKLIVETRKYGVDFTLAHQYLKQFDSKKTDALSTIGSTIIFNVNINDANYLLNTLQDKVSKEDIISLKKSEAIARIETDIVRIKTLPPLQIPSIHFRDRIIQESRAKYYKPAHEIKKWIRQGGNRTSSSIQPLVSSPPKTPDGQIKEFYYDEF